MLIDDEPRPKLDAQKPRDLTRLSIEELEEHITWLKGEIVRCEEDIVRKKKVAAAAENFFKSAKTD